MASTPLPTAVRTGLAWLGAPDKAKSVYEGRFGEGREACLARLFPSVEALLSQADFEPATRRLYEAFRAWVAGVGFAALPDAAPDDDGEEG